MSRRGAMWPTELTDEPEFVNLTPLAQWLFKLLWLHADLDSGGFIALQVEVWAKASAYLSPQEVEGALDELLTGGWVSVDDDTGELWLQPFIRLDAARKPNIFVAAMRAAQTRRSRRLRAEAWEVIDRVYQREPLKPPGDDADDKAWKAHTDRVKARTESYELLRAKVTREGFGNRSGTLRQPMANHLGVGGSVGGAGVPSPLCSRCGRHPPMERGLCGACLGRELGGQP